MASNPGNPVGLVSACRGRHHKRPQTGGPNSRNLPLSLEAGSLESKGNQSWFFLRAVKEKSVPGPTPWLLFMFTWRSPCISAWVHISHLYKDTNHVGLMTSF